MGWKQISIRLTGFTASATANTGHDELGWLFRSHADALYHFLLKQSDAELAQDISQQSWLKVLELQSWQTESASQAAGTGIKGDFQQRCQFKTWLFTLARNALFDELRRRQRWSGPELSEETMLDTQVSQLELLVAAERQQALQQAIEVLPLLQKEALLLQLEGFSLEDIASISGSAAETVKSRLRYARTSLSQALEHYHDHQA
ncbi:sigma-70 family RNA polymerase sigma factor [Rheinheimera sp.]|uniref:sigma-70 family RNA polymerase sigma factor n=1 Tax=Rheinheimera sp. TaxID=1869214 RepID=UPI002FDDACB2